MLAEVSQFLRCLCHRLLSSVILLYHLSNPSGTVEYLEDVNVPLVFQLLPVKISRCEDQQPSNMGICGISNVAKEIIDLKNRIG